jgi:putative ABC transport system permease protein
VAAIRAITPGYLEAMGIAVAAGRPFDQSDRRSGLRVAIVDQALAHRHWPDESPIGKRLRFGRPEANQPWMTIVGLVDTAKETELDEDPTAHLYVPYAQYGGLSLALAIRTSSDPSAMTNALRKEVQTLDPQLPIYHLQTMEDAVAESLNTRKLTNVLLGTFAAIALLLAAIGIYGVMSANVSDRIHEFGIRVALGAQVGNILTLVLRQGIVLVLLGIAIGVGGALAVTRFLSSLLYGVSSTDFKVFGAVSLLLAGVALFACYLPARRATKVDPVVALRYE